MGIWSHFGDQRMAMWPRQHRRSQVNKSQKGVILPLYFPKKHPCTWSVRSNLVHLGEIRKTRWSCIKSSLLDVGYIYGTSGSKLAKSSNTFHFYWPSGFLSLDSAFLLFQQFVAGTNSLGRLPPIFVTGNLPFPGLDAQQEMHRFGKDPGLQPKKHRTLSRNPIPISHPLENPQRIYQLDTHNFDQPHLQPFSKSLEAGTSHLFGRRVHLPGDVHRGNLNQLQ